MELVTSVLLSFFLELDDETCNGLFVSLVETFVVILCFGLTLAETSLRGLRWARDGLEMVKLKRLCCVYRMRRLKELY